MAEMRKIRGVRRYPDRLRNQQILDDLKAAKLSDLMEEKQLRYIGHVQRYPDSRWTKFLVHAQRPGQVKVGRQKQWIKEVSKNLISRNLNTEMMKDKNEWRKKLEELFPRRFKSDIEKRAVVDICNANPRPY